jgi:hypothetical protein
MDTSSFKVSVHRRKENVYLKVNGDYSSGSVADLLQALERVIMASAKFSTPGADTSFSFSTCSQVSPDKMRSVGNDRGSVESIPTPNVEELALRNLWRRKQIGAPAPSSSPTWRRLCSIIF